jgi:SSS family solute:Na+ symporter
MGTFIILAVPAVLLGLSAVVGLAAARGRQHISEDYFVAGRSLPWYVVAFSVAALSLRLEMWLGLLGLTYVAGIAAGGLAWGSIVGLTVLTGVFLPYFVRKKISSPAEFLERRYSPATRNLFALLAIAFLVLGVLVPALHVGGWVLSESVFNVPLMPITGIPWLFFVCVAAIALVSSLAGVIGGSMAGAWGGAVQFLVIAIGGTLFAVVATHDAGGLAALWETSGPARTTLLLSSHHASLPWSGMIAFALSIGFWNTAVSPLTLQRCLGARSEWDARLGAIVGGLLLLLLPAVFVLPGLAAMVKLGPQGNTGLAPEDSGLRLIEVLFGRQGLLGAAGQGLVVAAILAAVMNTVAAAVHAVSTLWTIDISQNLLGRNDSESELVARGRRSSLATIILATLLTPLLLCWLSSASGMGSGVGGVFSYVLEVNAIVGPPAVVVFLVGFFWSTAHGRAAVATLVAGCLVGATLWFVVAFGEAEVLPEWLKPVVTRAGVTGVASLVLLGLFTFVIPQSSGELYDPDATWSLDLTTLPPHERDAGAGLGNLWFWWGLLFASSIAVWIGLR